MLNQLKKDHKYIKAYKGPITYSNGYNMIIFKLSNYDCSIYACSVYLLFTTINKKYL